MAKKLAVKAVTSQKPWARAQLLAGRVDTMGSMKVPLPDIPPEQRTSAVEALLDLVRQLLDRVHQLEETNQQLRDEVAILRGQKPRPPISPSLLPLPASSATPAPKERRRGKPTRPRNTELTIHRAVALHPPTLPEGATLKG
jgi:hypothetical protein